MFEEPPFTKSSGCIFNDINTPCQKEECDVCKKQPKIGTMLNLIRPMLNLSGEDK